MAQIPVFQDGQILQPSSPVQIGNADTTPQEAMGSFGKALFNFGNKLDESQKRSIAKTKMYTADIAKAEFEQEMQLFNQKTVWEENKEITGLDAAKISIEYSDKVKQKLAQKYGLQGDEALKFQAETGAINNNLFPDLMKQSSKIVAERQISAREQAMNISVAKVFTNPQLFEEESIKMQEAIANDDDIINKPAEIIKRQKDLATGVVSKLIAEKQFGAAQKFVESNAGLYGPEAGKQIEDIGKAEIANINLDYTRLQRNQAADDRRFKEDNMKAMSTYVEMLKKAGNNQFEFDAVIEKATSDSRLKPEDLSNIQKNRVFMETRDDIYEGNIMERFNARKLNAQQVNDLVEKDYNKGEVSADRRLRIQKSLDNIKDSQRKDPTLERLVTQYYNKIDTLYTPKSTFDFDSAFSKGKFEREKDTTRIAFARELSRLATTGNYNADSIEGAYNRVVVRKIPDDTQASNRNKPQGVNISVLGDAKALQKEIENEAKIYAARGKKMTKQEVQDMKSRVKFYRKDLEAAKQRQEDKNITRPSQNKSGKRYDE